jgi:predicted RNase H-like HicB family nuclease
MNPQSSFSVSVLLHQDGDAWVAQCLEKDLVAQGSSEEEAKKRFLDALGAQIAWDLRDKRPPLSGLAQAPKRYFHDAVLAGQDGPELPVFVPRRLARSAG